jgi:hypothetical protein
MNIELLTKVRDAIEQHAEKFDYSRYFGPWYRLGEDPFSCGTVGCVAGFTVVVAGIELDAKGVGPTWMNEIQTKAGLALGLDEEQAKFLFHPSLADEFTILSDFDHTDAIDRIDWLLSGLSLKNYIAPPRKEEEEAEDL